jgi:hypothetical protein
LDEPFIDPTGEIAAYCDSTGRYLPLLCVSNMGNGYNAALERFGLTHGGFDWAVLTTPPGNHGRVLVPWYEGERTPDLPHAAPLYFGFGLAEFEPATLCRAVLEGHVLNLYEGFTRMPVTPREIRLTGGTRQLTLLVQDDRRRLRGRDGPGTRRRGGAGRGDPRRLGLVPGDGCGTATRRGRRTLRGAGRSAPQAARP